MVSLDGLILGCKTSQRKNFRANAKLCTQKVIVSVTIKIQDKCNFTALACNIPENVVWDKKLKYFLFLAR